MNERISKLMAKRGLCSRREAEKYIDEGLVFVNGDKVAMQGQKAPVDADIVLARAGSTLQNQKITVVLNKPLGFVSNLPKTGQKEARELLVPENRHDKLLRLSPGLCRWEEIVASLNVAGRLDVNSKGLLLFTQDGRVARQVIGPLSGMEKEYVIRFLTPVPQAAIVNLRHGLFLDGKSLKHARVTQKDPKTLIFVLKEGKKRQIRRMCEMVGLEVSSLKRVRIGPVQLGDLPSGKWRFLKAEENII